MEHPVARRRIRGAVAGLVATAVALGAAELAASSSRDLRSPVFDVGARFIDATPVWLKDFAIEYQSRPKAFLRLASDKTINEFLKLTGAHLLYGRRNTLLDPAGRALADIVEILPPAS